MSGHSGRPSDRYLRRIFADSNSREKEAKSDQSSRKTRVQREAQEQIRSELSTIERIGQWFAICISLAIVAFGLGASGLLIKDFLKLVSFAFIILFCSTTIGGSLGFLFAIPRLLKRSQQATEVVGVKTDSQAAINTKQPGAN